MHNEQIEMWEHHHLFNVDKKSIEKSTFIVVVITFVTMIAEILFGWLSHSMALLADGWHMGTHAFALGISLLAYRLARRYARDNAFSFGAWKIEILGAHTSAIVMALVGLFMIYASIERLIHPLAISYTSALVVAVLGLVVNVVCAVILSAGSHDHAHNHSHEGSHRHEDLNLKAAYLHVVADAVTSVLAIAALLGAKHLGIVWLDPVIGLFGAALILRWSAYLLKDTAKILLQREMDSPVAEQIKALIESDGDSKIIDLHVWQVAQNQYACIVSLVTGKERPIEEYKKRLSAIPELSHVTVEIYTCEACRQDNRLCR